MGAPELSGVTIVGAGSFNPAIIHPRWLADKELIPENAAEHAMSQEQPQKLIVTPGIAVFVADWLSMQVTQVQAIFSTVEQGRELDLRDFARGVFELLPETPVTAIGINADAHFRTGSEQEWHAFGDRFLPKDFWEPLFEDETWSRRPDGQHVGMRVMTVEVTRNSVVLPGYVRVEVAPSVRVTPFGVYTGINAHFQLSNSDRRANASDAARVLVREWEATRAIEDRLVSHLQEAL